MKKNLFIFFHLSLICGDKYILFSERGTNTLSFVYDHASQLSAAIHGIEDPTTGNGGCVKVKITDSPVTVIIRESLGYTDLIQDSCSGTSYYTASCPLMLDAPVVLNKTFYTGSGVVYADDISNSSSPATINGETVSKNYTNVPISFICNNLAEYMIKNYGRANADFYKVAEFASSDPNELSYCAISFVPRNDSDILKVGINSSLLAYNDKQAQPSCEGIDFDQRYVCSLPISESNSQKCTFIPGRTGGLFCNSRNSRCKKTASGNGYLYECKHGSYTCQFQTEGNYQGSEAITGGRCSFNVDLAFQSPNLGQEDFYCGFCTKAEMQTVGNSGYLIESGDSGVSSSGVGLPGYVYPFDTLGKTNPVTINGFEAVIK